MSHVQRSRPKQCGATRKDGQACTAPALGEAGFCFAHDPTRAAERNAARRKGGREHANAARLRNLVPPRLVAVCDDLVATLAEVRDSKRDPREAVAMATVARAIVAVVQAGELEERVRQMEARQREMEARLSGAAEGKTGTWR